MRCHILHALVLATALPNLAGAQTFSYGRSIFLHGLKRSECEFVNGSGCPGPIAFRAPDSLTARGVILGTPVVYPDPGDPSVATRVAALRAVLDAENSNAVLVGHSMGGVVARKAYLANSSKIAGIVTLDSPLRGAPIASNGPVARSMARSIGRSVANSAIPILDNNVLVRIILNAIVNNQVNKIMDGFFQRDWLQQRRRTGLEDDVDRHHEPAGRDRSAATRQRHWPGSDSSRNAAACSVPGV